MAKKKKNQVTISFTWHLKFDDDEEDEGDDDGDDDDKGDENEDDRDDDSEGNYTDNAAFNSEKVAAYFKNSKKIYSRDNISHTFTKTELSQGSAFYRVLFIEF